MHLTNASLSIAGDINTAETIKLVEKWFGAIQKANLFPGKRTACKKLQKKKF